MNWIHRVTFFAIALYVALAAIAFFAQRKMLYFPPNVLYSPPENISEIRTEANNLGWYSPAKDNLPTVMIFHGNASAIDSNLHIFRDLQNAGYGVWSVGYPGYPGAAGTLSQKNILAAAIDQYQHLSGQGAEKIVFYGTSLGSGVAAQLAAHHQPDLLILDAPFDSVAAMARKNMPILPIEVLLKDKWQSEKALEDLDVPLIWIHGTEDKIIPIDHGQKLYDGYGGPKSAHIISGASHINTWLNGGREIVFSALKAL